VDTKILMQSNMSFFLILLYRCQSVTVHYNRQSVYREHDKYEMYSSPLKKNAKTKLGIGPSKNNMKKKIHWFSMLLFCLLAYLFPFALSAAV